MFNVTIAPALHYDYRQAADFQRGDLILNEHGDLVVLITDRIASSFAGAFTDAVVLKSGTANVPYLACTRLFNDRFRRVDGRLTLSN